MARGYVYVLKNPSMPGMVKVGHTRDLAARLDSLSGETAAPVPFEFVRAVRVDDPRSLEAEMHRRLARHRVRARREFFLAEPAAVARLLSERGRARGGRVIRRLPRTGAGTAALREAVLVPPLGLVGLGAAAFLLGPAAGLDPAGAAPPAAAVGGALGVAVVLGRHRWLVPPVGVAIGLLVPLALR